MKWRLLLPGASGPRLAELNPPGLQIGLSSRVTRPEQPEHSCRWQLWIGPLRRSHLGQKHVLYALVDPVSAPLSGISCQESGIRCSRFLIPDACSLILGIGGAAGYCPRVR